LPQIHDFMKKYIYLFISVFVLASCTEDVKFNTPAFQGLKDNVFWRSQNYTAYTTIDGDLFIEGGLGAEKVSLKLPSPIPQTYILGVDDIATASYSNVFPSETPQFTTGTNMGNGQVVITDFDVKNNTISGTFKFTAVNSNAGDGEKPEIHFTEGVFYKIPYTSKVNF